MKKVISAYGTADASDDATLTYTSNGQVATLADANGNVTTYGYDGFGRLSQIRYPSPTTAGVSSTTDYEAVILSDPNGNVLQRRLRDGQSIDYTYDALNRVTAKVVPHVAYAEYDISYNYDLLGRLTQATNSLGHSVVMTYDALGRTLSDNNPFYGKSMQYDLAGRLTRLTWADGNYIAYDHLVTGEVSAVRENGATSGVGVLASYGYDALGRRSTLTRGNGTVTTWAYDPVSRLAELTHDLGGTANDVTTTFGYNPAGQIGSTTRSNDSYAWTGHYDLKPPYTVNGLNQLTSVGVTALGYDGRGNLTRSGADSYTYTSENRLATASATQLYYDPLGRLLSSTVGTRFDETGDHITTELNGSTNAVERRYVWGPGDDEPLVWYEGSGMTDRRWLIQDERGSVVAATDASGNAIAINRYDEYGIPATTNIGRFQYTGQAWLSELGLYYYKARMYSPTLGRFMQTDPIGYGDGMNQYAYVGNDPVNFGDPLGLGSVENNYKRLEPLTSAGNDMKGNEEIVVTGPGLDAFRISSILDRLAPPTNFNGGDQLQNGDIVVTCNLVCQGKRAATQIGNQLEGRFNRPFVIAHNLLFPPACAQSDREAACNLNEQLAIESARGSVSAVRIMQGRINDPRYPGNIWGKFSYIHSPLIGRDVEVHFWRNLLTGTENGFKIKR